MKINEYIIYIAFFSIIPLILFILLLLPYISPFGFIYYFVKPYGMQVFGNKIAMWSFVGVLSAAIGILIGLIYQHTQRKNKAKNLTRSLKEEILNNIQLLFTGEVERPYYYEAFETIKREYPDIITDNEAFRKIRSLYDELRYYQEIVNVWRPTNPGDIVTERQLGACIKYIEYFETPKSFRNIVAYVNTPKKDTYQNKRTRAIEKKDKNLSVWEKTLEKKVQRIFIV